MSRTARQRAADVKLIVAATIAVVLGGLLVAGGLLAVSGGEDAAVCGRLPVGPAESVRANLESGGPFFQTGGEGCSYWLTLVDGDIVALKAKQDDGCTLDLEARGEEWVCDGRGVDPAELDEYPVSIVDRDGTETVEVDLRPEGARTATT